jgi:hypothetical protein
VISTHQNICSVIFNFLMASSFPSRPVYDQESKSFTAVGLHFLRCYHVRNPHPDKDALKQLANRIGCEFLKLRVSEVCCWWIIFC